MYIINFLIFLLVYSSNVYSQNEFNPSSASPETKGSASSGSYHDACFGADGEYKTIQYQDGILAKTTSNGGRSQSCGCLIKTPRQIQLLQDNVSPWEVTQIYNNYRPFYGCPNYSDYLKISRLINQDDRSKEMEKSKRIEERKILINKLVTKNRQFCKAIPRIYTNITESLGYLYKINPNSITLQRVAPYDDYLTCIATWYTPKGPISCKITLGNTGIIDGFRNRYDVLQPWDNTYQDIKSACQ